MCVGNGAAGQDGWYLLKSLLARGYVVHAQSRKSNSDTHLGPVDWHCGSLTDADFLASSSISSLPPVRMKSTISPRCRARSIGISKLSAHLTAGAFRRHYGLHIWSGIMFNHESPRRPLSYVSQKIAHAAAAAALGLRENPFENLVDSTA